MLQVNVDIRRVTFLGGISSASSIGSTNTTVLLTENDCDLERI